MTRGRHNDPRIADEIRFHRDRLIEDYIAEGLDRREAERRAFLELGNPRQIEEAVRDVRGRWLADLLQDLRYALRMLRRSPGFASVAILSLALGIGANTAIFSLINAVVLRTLPVVEPDRLVQIARLRSDGQPSVRSWATTATSVAAIKPALSYPLFEHFRDNLQSVSGIFALGTGDRAVVMDGETEFVTTAQVSGSYYAVLGVDPAVGRVLGPADDDRAAPATAVISDAYWQRHFARSTAALGTTFTIDDRVVTIVGVTPPSFQSAQTGFVPDITLPLLQTMSDAQRQGITNNWLRVLARLKPGVSVEQASAEVEVMWSATLPLQAVDVGRDDLRAEILRQRGAALPAPDGVNPLRYLHARSLHVLMGIVGLVLLLACVNLSGLLLARATARQRETSVRLAIGAGRGRLARQVLTENVVLATIGGAIGFAMAGWLSAMLLTLVADGQNITLSVAPDWRVLAFTVVVSLVACVAAGFAPVLHAVRAPLTPALRDTRVHGTHRLGRALVVAQLALSMVLVVSATMFVGTLVNLHAVDRGFDSNGVVIVNIGSSRQYSAERGAVVQATLLERLEALPGVRSASTASMLPGGGGLWTRGVRVEGYEFRDGESNVVAFNVIAPKYFETIGTPLVSGREFDRRDTGTSPKVAIVNESFARHFFAQEPAIGRRVTSLDASYEIVGVARDAKYQSLREDGILKTMYIPWAQREGAQPSGSYVVRAAGGDPMRLVPDVERVVRDTDPALRVRSATTYATFIGRTIVTERIMATLGGIFGVLALVVAVVGVFGVLAFQVARRTNEIGVRMALGADGWAMMRLVLRDVAVMVLAGVSIGAGAALMVTDLARNLLFGLTPTDPRAFLVAASMLAAASFLAAWLPARRAARVDPLVALRHE